MTDALPVVRPVVLLVEDELPLRRAMRDVLQREGFQVLEAGDGAEALTAIDRATPDVAVLDINLPVLDGFAVLSRLRTRASTARLPILILTARADQETEMRGLALGADDFLTKPFRPTALAARLRSLLAQT
ncbi:MAG TPA: response regulator [Gemmatimonadaceae bacterium]|jgi:DNA-binding response OmpR family regulator|nr:response regulator [Gemmatimonadaceae bacterium]